MGMGDLGALGGELELGAMLRSINDVGQVVGESFTDEGGNRAFITSMGWAWWTSTRWLTCPRG